MPAALRPGCASAGYRAPYSNSHTWCIPGQRPRRPALCPAGYIPTRAARRPCPGRPATTQAPRRHHSPPSRSYATLRRLAPRRLAPPRTLLTVRGRSPSWPARVLRPRTYDTCGPPRPRNPSASTRCADLDRSCPPSSRKWPPGSDVRRQAVPKLVALEQRRHPACWEAVGDVSVGDPVQHLREARFVVQFTRELLRLLQPVHHFLVRFEFERGRCPPEDHVTQLLGRRVGDLLQ